MTSLTLLFSSFVSGKPPSVFRSQSVVVVVSTPEVCRPMLMSVTEVVEELAVVMCTRKVPPVEGWRDTSPRERLNVERSSCAYWIIELCR